jgi:DNA-binding XRE family transcriptional regulator
MLKTKSKSIGLSRFRDPVIIGDGGGISTADTMGERIRALREQAGLTQTELGDRVGVSFSAVNQWESGATQNIKTEPFARLLDLFGVDHCFLVWGRKTIPPLAK